ncbi:MAG: HDOD domain-containing protein [Candidatus Hodarchaeales archaeon]|jgi:putative nucleotidyltransferase with HDIG domain
MEMHPFKCEGTDVESTISLSGLAPIEIDPKTFLYEHCTLPALPEVVGKIQGIMESYDTSTVQVTHLISSDAALVAEVLKMANSAYYGLPREIGDIKMGVALLGVNEVYRIKLLMSVKNALATDQKSEFDKIWLHSLLTAHCAKYLAKEYDPYLPVDEIWTAAILHDIGKFVYLKFFPEHLKALTQFREENGCLFSEAEKHLSLPSSAYLGALLCDRWRLPGKIKDACNSHTLQDLLFSKEKDSPDAFIRMIILGNLIAVLTTEELNPKKKNEIVDAIKTTLSLGKKDFLLLMGKIW